MIIGVAGWARSGKDTVGSILQAQGFQKAAFADSLRDFVQELNPIVSFKNDRPGGAFYAVRYTDMEPSRPNQEYLRLTNEVGRLLDELGYGRSLTSDFLSAVNPIVCHTNDGPGRPMFTLRYMDILDTYGYDEAKERYDEFRRTLQYVGTEGGRKLLDDNIWVDAALSRMETDKSYVLTDVRFPNEADAIRSNGGEVWWVSRPGIRPLSDHASENSLNDYDFDHIILNDSDMTYLESEVLELINR